MAATIIPIDYQLADASNLNGRAYDLVQCGTYINIYVNTKADSTLRVAVKSLRTLPEADPRIARWLTIVSTLQSQMLNAGVSHDHLEPFRVMHIIESGKTLPAIVSQWHKNKDILRYVRNNPGVDKLELIYQTISAMSHLHARGIVHGNLHAGNILITHQGTVRVADAGLNTHIMQHMPVGCLPIPAAWMYKAPEELLDGSRTVQTDAYSLASTIYAIYACRPPYQRTSFCDVRGIREIATRGHQQIFEHSKPAAMSDAVWGIVRHCWEYDAQRRPLMSEIATAVQELLGRVS